MAKMLSRYSAVRMRARRGGGGRSRSDPVAGRILSEVALRIPPGVEVDGAALRQQHEVDVVRDADVARFGALQVQVPVVAVGDGDAVGAALVQLRRGEGVGVRLQRADELARTCGGSIGYASLWSRSAYGVSTSARASRKPAIGDASVAMRCRQPREEVDARVDVATAHKVGGYTIIDDAHRARHRRREVRDKKRGRVRAPVFRRGDDRHRGDESRPCTVRSAARGPRACRRKRCSGSRPPMVKGAGVQSRREHGRACGAPPPQHPHRSLQDVC